MPGGLRGSQLLCRAGVDGAGEGVSEKQSKDSVDGDGEGKSVAGRDFL